MALTEPKAPPLRAQLASLAGGVIALLAALGVLPPWALIVAVALICFAYVLYVRNRDASR
jgi:Flp pilus assembly protein TadB